MDEIQLHEGIGTALDALFADRLAILCGAGLSMAAPSDIPSAAALAEKAKGKYDATYGGSRDPLPQTIDAQTEFFFQRGELFTVYLRTYIDRDVFAAVPNSGHYAIDDLLLTGAITTAASTNVDTLIESAGNFLFGQVGVGVSRAQVAALPVAKSPLLKIHGCWSDPLQTIWAAGQVAIDPTHTRLVECGVWLGQRLLDRDLVIVGYWTDWDYLNEVLATALGSVNPSRVIVVDPCETHTFGTKAPALHALGQRAGHEFSHVRCSGDAFLDQLRVEFSRSFIRRALHAGGEAYQAHTGVAPEDSWMEPASTNAEVLWRIRRDLEGANPNEPARSRLPIEEPLLGMTMLQLRAAGAVPDGMYWNLGGSRVRVLRTANRALHEVEAAFARETAPVVAPEYVIAVGAEAIPLLPSFARGRGSGTIARGSSAEWLSRADAIGKLGI
jgi:hypothetical protein